MGLKQKLRLVWDETTSAAGGSRQPTARRFVAKSLNGGEGWGVYDTKRRRFLKDREVAAMTENDLRETVAN